jgi:hypothetical protein
MTHRTLAFIKTPIKVGDLVSMLNGEGAWEMELVIHDGVLEVRG